MTLPWRRTLLEGVVIIASILIAFSLDAWWDRLGRAEHEREALRALAEELRGAAVELDSVIAFNQHRVEAGHYFLSLSPADVAGLESDNVTLALAGMGGGLTFDPSLGATNAIISGGLDLVRDADVRAQIAAWPGMMTEIAIDQAAIAERWEKVSDTSVRAGFADALFLLSPEDTAGARALAREALATEEMRQRVAALARSIRGLLDELRDVDARLRALREAVNRALAEAGGARSTGARRPAGGRPDATGLASASAVAPRTRPPPATRPRS
jgi:hypothetical protein